MQGAPATVRVRVHRDGHDTYMNLCDEDYARFQRHERRNYSPFESLFGRGFFEEFDDILGALGPSGASWPSRGRPVRAREGSDTVDISRYFSEQAKELLQAAAEKAAEWGQPEVDTEHLLYVLADNEVAQAIFKQFRISPSDVKGYLEYNSPRAEKPFEGKEIGVSPRVKSA